MDTPEALVALINYASSIRATAATGVHDASSRSHAICRIHVRQPQARAGRAASLTLVDLAGSEIEYVVATLQVRWKE